ncbi:MAG: ribonuclease Z, partial [Bacteroidetes bacterium]
MKFSLTILGVNSAIPANGRVPTSQILQVQSEKFLIDCGEGCQIRMDQYGIGRSNIN